MQTSRKLNNVRHKFLGAILGICLISGCRTAAPPAAVQTSSQPAQTAVTGFDASVFTGVKVCVKKQGALYQKKESGQYEAVGRAMPEGIFDIDETEGQYAHIADSPFYLDGTSLAEAGRWYVNRNHLVWDGSMITTVEGYQIENLKGEVILEVSSRDTYNVYVKPMDGDQRYGIQLQNEIVYIPKDQVESEAVVSLAEPVLTADRLPVLMYHFFYDESVQTRKDGNDVSTDELNEQLDWLSNEHYATLTMREVLYFMQGRASIPIHSVAITIDDNDSSVHEYAYPIIKAHNMNATVFLIAGWEDPTLSWDNWEMREDGLELQSHGFLMHQGGCSGMGHGGRLLCVDYSEGVADTIRSFDYVDGGFVYCYPFGDVDDRSESIVRDAGGLLAFTTEYGMISPGMDLLRLPRIRVTGGAGMARYTSSIEVKD